MLASTVLHLACFCIIPVVTLTPTNPIPYCIGRFKIFCGEIFVLRTYGPEAGVPVPAANTLASFWMSWWALARLALMALRLASWSSLNREGTGPAVASPSNMVAEAGQADSSTVGMSSLE